MAIPDGVCPAVEAAKCRMSIPEQSGDSFDFCVLFRVYFIGKGAKNEKGHTLKSLESDEKFDDASVAQSLCGIAITVVKEAEPVTSQL